jgi:THO complex subunit 3
VRVAASELLVIWSGAGKCSHKVDTSGENINISWSPDGKQIAVGNKVLHWCIEGS